MALCVCEYCGKPYNSLGSSICSGCMKELDEAYMKARKYIYLNPGSAKFISIVENTEVSDKALRFLIKQGRIILEDKTGSGIKCRICGKETEGGQVCEHCRKQLVSQSFFSEAERAGRSGEDKVKREVIPLQSKKM